MMEWISVEERLPGRYQNVLFYGNGYDPVTRKTRGDTGVGYYRKAFRFDGRDSAEVTGVTHWMPLPDPPEAIDG